MTEHLCYGCGQPITEHQSFSVGKKGYHHAKGECVKKVKMTEELEFIRSIAESVVDAKKSSAWIAEQQSKAIAIAKKHGMELKFPNLPSSPETD